MRIKALLSFTGAVTMYPGEERTVSNETGQDLIQAGLAISIDEPEAAELKAEGKPPKEKETVKEA